MANYKRVLLKLSGEALAGEKKFGFDEATCIQVAEQVKKVVDAGVEVAIVIGGGVSKAGPILLEYVEKYYQKYCFKSCKNVKFALATLGNDAGIFGSAKMVL